ncbi:dnaJ homolog subfamily C member 15 isoform X2 [Parus major]|uniref:dnaJ homolog subfamily C member 15 isoform X2 n=1 Tax=Parus major TaxID=9157 RepID=UPI001443C7DD|nr:dnaJ homolog subfamily C member 15 isoform X2 [Parus major]
MSTFDYPLSLRFPLIPARGAPALATRDEALRAPSCRACLSLRPTRSVRSSSRHYGGRCGLRREPALRRVRPGPYGRRQGPSRAGPGAGRYAFRVWKPLEQTITEAAKRISTSSFSSYYKGGFEQKMSRREASLILGVRHFNLFLQSICWQGQNQNCA